MRIIAFLSDYGVVDRIINHLKLTFRKFWWPPKQAPNIFYDLLFDLGRGPVDLLRFYVFLASLSPPSAIFDLT